MVSCCLTILLKMDTNKNIFNILWSLNTAVHLSSKRFVRRLLLSSRYFKQQFTRVLKKTRKLLGFSHRKSAVNWLPLYYRSPKTYWSTTNEPHQWQVLKNEIFGNSLLHYPLLELVVFWHYVNSPCYCYIYKLECWLTLRFSTKYFFSFLAGK